VLLLSAPPALPSAHLCCQTQTRQPPVSSTSLLWHHMATDNRRKGCIFLFSWSP
jgi:hypothetical protein